MSSGSEADTALISCLLNVIDRAMRTKVTRFQSTHPRLTGVSLRSALKGFRRSTAARVADRLNDKHRERDANFAAQRSARTALILVRYQFVEEASDRGPLSTFA
jgi:hypothetical protein